MNYKTINYDKVSVQMSVFASENGCTEYHLMIHCRPEGDFGKQIEELHSALDAVMAEQCKGAAPVFIRYFLSDISNQEEQLQQVLQSRRRCAVSIIGQPPLDGSKVAVWAYLATGVKPVCLGDGLWSAEYLGHTHLWMGGSCGHGEDSERQMGQLLDKYSKALELQECSIAGNCLRTWIFVQDVDMNYAGAVVGRRDRFMQLGLTKDTHYIASTGIAGSNAHKDSVVSMDAYAVAGIPSERIRYLKGSTHLNPTHEYGVTFERGTAVDFEDRSHVLISGTASIDNKGQILHPGDICRQTERMWENVSVLLEEAGAGYDDVMHMTVYLRDMADHTSVRKMYEERFPHHPKVFLWAPVCRPGWLIEMECMAVRKQPEK